MTQAGRNATGRGAEWSPQWVTRLSPTELCRDASGPASWWLGGWDIHLLTLTPHSGER